MCATTTTEALKSALAAILGEVIDYPATRPYDSDSHLPDHLVEQARDALLLAGFDVASLQYTRSKA